MSDITEGPGWWIASDGKWYPPHLHPSVEEQDKLASTAPGTEARLGVDLPGKTNPNTPVESSESVLDDVAISSNGASGANGTDGSTGVMSELLGSSRPPEPGSEEAKREAAAIATALLAAHNSSRSKKDVSHEERLKHLVVGSLILVAILVAGAGITATILPARSQSGSTANTSSPPNGPTAQVTTTTQAPIGSNLSSYILALAPGWSAVRTLGPTGRLSSNQAGSLGCDGLGGVALTEKYAWVASQSSTWGGNPAYPGTTISICLSALGSPTDASANLGALVATLVATTGLHETQPASAQSLGPPGQGVPVVLVSGAGSISTYDVLLVRGSVLMFLDAKSTSLTAGQLQAVASQIYGAQAARLPG